MYKQSPETQRKQSLHCRLGFCCGNIAGLLRDASAKFSKVIIDEAGQAKELETLIPFVLAETVRTVFQY